MVVQDTYRSSEAPRSVVFSGYYGMSNFGDDVFAAVCTQAARVYWRVEDASYLSPPIRGAVGRCIVPDRGLFKYFSSPGSFGRMARGLALARGVSKTEMFVLGGGSILSQGSFGTRDMLVLAAAFRRLRLSAIGVSVGPFSSIGAERSVRRFLRGCEFISVRDRYSYDVAMQLELPSTVRLVSSLDLAGNYPVLFNIPSPSVPARKPIGVALCRYESLVGGQIDEERMRLEAIVAAAKELAIADNRPVYVFSLNGHAEMGDDKISRGAYAKLISSGVDAQLFQYPFTDTRVIWQLIRSCAIMLTIRLHGAIAAYLEGVPIVLAEYHQKCGDFLDDIGQPAQLRVGANASRSDMVAAASAALACHARPMLSPGEYAAKARHAFSLAPWMPKCD